MSLTGKVRVALVQNASQVGTEEFDPRDLNLENAIPYVRRAAEEGAQLVVFGEMYLSGYRTDEYLYKYATVIDPPDRHLETLVAEVDANKIHVLMGAATFGDSVPGDIYNSAILIGPDRGLIGVYRKAHVAGFPYSKGVSTERCFYSPGKELPVFDTAIGRIGIHICYDIAFPEVSRVQTIRGADYLVNISAAADGFEDYWEHLPYARAFENAIWYVLCSVVGEQRGETLLVGGSKVLDPTGQVVANAGRGEERFLLVDIDPTITRFVRGTLHILNTRQPELYGEVTRPLRHP